MIKKELTIIGRNTPVDLVGYVSGVPAKIDTGADSSSVWATSIKVNKAGTLQFCLFGESSPYYTGEVISCDMYSAALVKSSSGHEQVRFRTVLDVRLSGRRMKTEFNLSDRAKHKFPVLIGRRTLSGKFMVDVTQSYYGDKQKTIQSNLNKALQADPYGFYMKHYGKVVD